MSRDEKVFQFFHATLENIQVNGCLFPVSDSRNMSLLGILAEQPSVMWNSSAFLVMGFPKGEAFQTLVIQMLMVESIS